MGACESSEHRMNHDESAEERAARKKFTVVGRRRGRSRPARGGWGSVVSRREACWSCTPAR